MHDGWRRVHVMLRREGQPDNVRARRPAVPQGRPVAAAETAAAQQGRQVASAQAGLTGTGIGSGDRENPLGPLQAMGDSLLHSFLLRSSHGRNGVVKMRIGSVAAKVLEPSPMPVPMIK